MKQFSIVASEAQQKTAPPPPVGSSLPKIAKYWKNPMSSGTNHLVLAWLPVKVQSLIAGAPPVQYMPAPFSAVLLVKTEPVTDTSASSPFQYKAPPNAALLLAKKLSLTVMSPPLCHVAVSKSQVPPAYTAPPELGEPERLDPALELPVKLLSLIASAQSDTQYRAPPSRPAELSA